MSGIPLEPVYGPEGSELPGQYPYTRGPYASMYRSRLWTMRQFAGFGTAAGHQQPLQGAAAGRRRRSLDRLRHADASRPRLRRPVWPRARSGRAGVAIDTLADMEILFAGIDLGEVSTSMTINSAPRSILAMYVGVADRTGVERSALVGHHPERHSQGVPGPEGVRLPAAPVGPPHHRHHAVLPRPSCPAGTPCRSRATTSVRPGRRPPRSWRSRWPTGSPTSRPPSPAGLAVDDFAPRLSFFFNAHIDFFEEIAKYRAARRIWARWMRERYGASDGRSLQLRFHTQTAGVSLTAQQPEVNLVRVAIEALAGVLGWDPEPPHRLLRRGARPTHGARGRLALRTQQVIAEESGVVHVADPLGGSWFVEELTDELERQAEEVFAHLLEAGSGSVLEGVFACIDDGWFVSEIADAAYAFQSKVARDEWKHGGGQRLRRGRQGCSPPRCDRPGGRGGPARVAGRGQASPGRRGGTAQPGQTGQGRSGSDDQPDAGPHRGRGTPTSRWARSMRALESVFGTFVERNVA